ncbi:response regulator [Denitrificimonas caeni]|uniref:response regulator n=1 Tax=Denitrificimonas caeni TaxID=521720 RepID=UPI0003B55B0C|nr:response regulator [Denitrificimonas caeni]
MRILVVDDDQLAGEMITAVLEDQGHHVFQAENALHAIELLGQQSAIELIVSDLNMPLMSGIELFRELREQGLNLPFILLSGDDPAALRAKEPNLDACIMKDFSMDESLPAAIDAVMAARDAITC